MFKIKVQLILTIGLFSGYFLLLGAMFYIEVSDSLNMKKGDNSMIGELQVLLGVLTAAVTQTLNYWFGSTLDSNDEKKSNHKGVED